MIERTGEAFEFDEKLTVVGGKLQAGDAAPNFELEYLDPAKGALRKVTLSEMRGKPVLLNIVNSVDTPVCDVETKRWETLRGDYPSDLQVLTVSMDLPFALGRWQASEGVTHPTVSAHKSTDFGQDYGVLLKEWRLLQRAVILIDGAGKVAYAEYVPDQMAEPDYDAASQAIGQVGG